MLHFWDCQRKPKEEREFRGPSLRQTLRVARLQLPLGLFRAQAPLEQGKLCKAQRGTWISFSPSGLGVVSHSLFARRGLIHQPTNPNQLRMLGVDGQTHVGKDETPIRIDPTRGRCFFLFQEGHPYPFGSVSRGPSKFVLFLLLLIESHLPLEIEVSSIPPGICPSTQIILS